MGIKTSHRRDAESHRVFAEQNIFSLRPLGVSAVNLLNSPAAICISYLPRYARKEMAE